METFDHVIDPVILRIHHDNGDVVAKLGRILRGGGGGGSRTSQVSQTKITTFKVVYHQLAKDKYWLCEWTEP